MPLLYLVRHGRVTDTPLDARDPELDAIGHVQAEAVRDELRHRLHLPLRILSSPLRRCRETAAPLAQAWGVQPVVEPRVIEVPSPRSDALDREDWIRRTLASSWDEAAQLGERHQGTWPEALEGWRRDVLQAVLDCSADTVIFSHFVPINVLVGAATGAQQVMSFRPANGSITVFETVGGAVRLIKRGREVDSRVV